MRPRPEDVAREAQRMVGWPYLHQGRNENGVDCLGVLVLTARALGVEVHDDRTYSRWPDAVELVKYIKKNPVIWVPRREVALGDMVVFVAPEDAHLGVVTDGYNPFGVVHAYRTNRGVIETPLVLDKVRSVYRLQLIAKPAESRRGG